VPTHFRANNFLPAILNRKKPNIPVWEQLLFLKIHHQATVDSWLVLIVIILEMIATLLNELSINLLILSAFESPQAYQK